MKLFIASPINIYLIKTCKPRIKKYAHHFLFFGSNAVVPCESLPIVDLSLWKDIGAGAGGTVPEQPYPGFPDHDFLLKK